MQFRYREMIYRPDYYIFSNEDREEWFPNGIFNYNVSRLIRDLAMNGIEKDKKAPWLNTVVRTCVSVEDTIHHCHGLGKMEDAHIQAADLERPLIFVEIAPDCFNLIDGHHRLEKARREGLPELPAWMVDAHAAIRYLGSESEYSRYVAYWNSKIEDIGEAAEYKGLFCPCPAPLQERDFASSHIWNRMSMCLNECRRVEVYSEGVWFTLFRLNGKLYCGEAEEHEPSIRCQTPFHITPDMIESAAGFYEDWYGYTRYQTAFQEKRRAVRKSVRHADVLMACIRVFSEYEYGFLA